MNKHCDRCGFTLWWHPLSGGSVKTPRAFCPVRQERDRYRGRFQYHYVRPDRSAGEWIPNVDGRGRPIDRNIYSSTWAADELRGFCGEYLDARAADRRVEVLVAA